MNAEELVAVAQALSLRVDEEQDRPAGMLAHRFDDAFGHRERQFDAHLCMPENITISVTAPNSNPSASTLICGRRSRFFPLCAREMRGQLEHACLPTSHRAPRRCSLTITSRHPCYPV